jgi:D-alanine--poly(phosphoribitol) ligase subunit 1
MYEYNLGLVFQRVASARAAHPAIWLGPAESVSYGELDRLANRIARLLLRQGVAAGDVVCLAGDKAPSTFAAMLGCLKIGAPYAVFDPAGPGQRLGRILSTCQPKAVLAGSQLLDELRGGEASPAARIPSDEAALEAAIRGLADTELELTRAITGAAPAYIMFTSGSSGFPKGAVITHASVLNFVSWTAATFEITAEDVFTNVNPLFFDNSVFDIYASLCNGATLVPCSAAEVHDPGRLIEKIEAARCSIWFSVPSLLVYLQTMRAMDGRHLGSVRAFIFGGEGYPKTRLKALYDAYSPHSALFNVYGPTECTCICSCYRLTGADFEDLRGVPALGQVADNFAFLVLDEHHRRVAPGELGELCLVGPNVGKGYYRDPERTAASFVQNPHNDRFPEIMYKTGDLVRCDPCDGRLHIHGRRDNQIKHLGYRIELEEIEGALNELPYVAEAAVLHMDDDGLSRLAAFVAAAPTSPSDDEIRGDLRRALPDYMIPAVFHRRASLPRSANGKLDRRALTEALADQGASSRSAGA